MQENLALIVTSPALAETLRPDLPQSLEIEGVERLSGLKPTLGLATVLILDPSFPDLDPLRLRALPRWIVILATPGPAAECARESGRLFLTVPMGDGQARERRERLRAAVLHADACAAAERSAEERELAARDLFELTELGAALMQPRDADDLMTTILREARRVTSSDAGSLYLVQDDRLHFHWTQNDSLAELSQPDMTVAIDRKSFAGYAAATGEVLRIADAYQLDPGVPYRFDQRFDQANAYRTGAVLVVPMSTPAGRTVGVLQLLNPAAGRYSARDQQIAKALGGQAAVSIENQRLRSDIENLFEGFILAAVTAIDQRDPGTSGHSVRVAELTCALAQRADASHIGPFEAVRFDPSEIREIRYAALLHDFGKVFVSEQVLGKDRKLPPTREAQVFARFDRAQEVLEATFHRERARYLNECGHAGFEDFEKELRRGIDAERTRLQSFEQAVRRANEPRVLPTEVSAELEAVISHRMLGFDNQEFGLVELDDLNYLCVPKGSLTDEERQAIESHVTYTHRFLEQIPWTGDLAAVDSIAWGHHEKLDGSGYPRGLTGEQIPIQTRMLTIADIYDALTAADRPYKKALPLEKALDILHSEAKAEHIDGDLLELFCATRPWERLSRA